jgi:hypothetical protein
MARKYTSDGINTTLEYGFGVRETVSDANYSADTGSVRKTHSESGIQETATQRNVDIKGNSQETYYTRGVTCESSIKVVGNPDQFDGAYYKKAHKALAELAALLTQPGDDKKSSSMPSFPSIDLKQAIGNMSSSYAATNPPPTPHISKASDVMDYLSAIGKWFGNYVSADSAEVAMRAGQLELEKQANQQLENAKAQAQETINSAEAILSGGIPAGSGATEDRNKEVSYEIDQKTVLNTVNQDHLIEIQRHC